MGSRTGPERRSPKAPSLGDKRPEGIAKVPSYDGRLWRDHGVPLPGYREDGGTHERQGLDRGDQLGTIDVRSRNRGVPSDRVSSREPSLRPAPGARPPAPFSGGPAPARGGRRRAPEAPSRHERTLGNRSARLRNARNREAAPPAAEGPTSGAGSRPQSGSTGISVLAVRFSACPFLKPARNSTEGWLLRSTRSASRTRPIAGLPPPRHTIRGGWASPSLCRNSGR